MKKSLLILSILLCTIQINAQNPDPDLFNQTWYMYEVYDSDFNDYFYVEGYQPYGGEPEIPQITPYVIIDENLDFSGLGICNTFSGSLVQHPTENLFRTVIANQTNFSCGFYEDIDEPYLIGPFGYVDPDPDFYTIFNPQITDDVDGFQTLVYLTQPFIVYTYRNTPILSSTDFNKNEVSIFPNPTSDILFISSENVIIEKLSMHSVSGKLIFEQVVNENRSVDVSMLSDGLYFIELRSEKGRSIQKFIKK